MKAIYKQLKYTLPLSIIVIIIMYLIQLATGTTMSHKGRLLLIYFIVVYTFALHMLNSLVFIWIGKCFNNKLSTKRLLVSFIASVTASIIIIFILRVFEEIAINGKSLSEFFLTEEINNYYFATAISFIFSLIAHLFYYYKNYQENRVKQQQIIAGTASAKFESLKNQIDPHFLFNSLNVLSSLIEENPENAQRFTTALSKVYRYVLDQKDKELVTVEEELAFAKTYMNLLKMRFEDSVFYELPVTVSNPDAMVVPLSLQLLLENTVKHYIVRH